MDNTNHGFQIEKLKGSFVNILQVIDEINGVKKTANETLHKLKDAYNALIQQNHEKVFLFCLDSFFFQYKSFQLELENLKKGFSFINNRMYCDYYKLYKMIINTIKEQKQEFKEECEQRNYVPYKDLEPFQEYRIDDIKDVHQNILHIIKLLFEKYQNKRLSISNYYEEHQVGFSISNFINTLEYENGCLNQQIMLYINYIAFFHISQKQYLKRCFQRFKAFYKEVEENIQTNKSFSIHDIHFDPIVANAEIENEKNIKQSESKTMITEESIIVKSQIESSFVDIALEMDKINFGKFEDSSEISESMSDAKVTPISNGSLHFDIDSDYAEA
jgi:hypothetical protein